MLICETCIRAIESRGEKILTNSQPQYADENEELICSWCNETTDKLVEVTVV